MATERRQQVTVALTSGLAVASAMFFLIAAIGTPGLDPPPETAAMFVLTTTIAVVAVVLLAQDSPTGYPVAILAGGVVVATVALTLLGTFGPAGPRTNPVGPLFYVSLALAVVVEAVLAWRSAGAEAAGSEVSTPV